MEHIENLIKSNLKNIDSIDEDVFKVLKQKNISVILVINSLTNLGMPLSKAQELLHNSIYYKEDINRVKSNTAEVLDKTKEVLERLERIRKIKSSLK